MLETMFYWMTQDLAEFKLNPTELFDDCLDKDLGQFIHHFGWEFVESLLVLTDDEVTEIYPKTECPLSYDERQSLKTKLHVHVLSCQSCTDAELQSDAITLMIEKTMFANKSNHQLALTI